MSIYVAFYLIITFLYILLTRYSFVVEHASNMQKKMVTANTSKRIFVVITAGLLILILGLRSEYQGLDLYNSLGTGYFYYYHKINDDSLMEIFKYFGDQKYANFEIGFVLMSKLIGTLCSNHQILLFACALLSIIPVAYFIFKHSPNAWLSMVLYMALPLFATATFSAIRQGISIGIVVLALGYIKEKKMLPFIVAIIVACTFHSTAIVALVCYPIYYVRLEKKSALFGGAGLLAAIYFLKEPLFWILARIVHSDPKIYRTNSINLFLLFSAIYVICVLFCKKDDYETRGYINIFWLACAAQSFAEVHNLASRITWYFMPALIVIIPNLVQNINIKEKNLLKPMGWIIGILAILLGLNYLKNNSMAMAYPYVFFWNQ